MSCHGVGEGGYKLCYDNHVPDYGENGHGFSKITNEGSDSRPFLLNPLIRKLSNHTDLSASDRDALERLVQRSQHVAARTDLVQEGDPTGSLYLILTGWACRYKGLPNGERQIIAYFIPGDLCDQRMFILKQMDHSIGTITSATVVGSRNQAITNAPKVRTPKASLTHQRIQDWMDQGPAGPVNDK